MPWKILPAISDEEASSFARSFRKKARFLIDESVGPFVAEVLRELKLNAVAASEVGLNHHDDEALFAYAWRNNRILVSHDKHFLDARKYPHYKNPGVFVVPGGSGSDEGLLVALRQIVSMASRFREIYRGQTIEIAEDGTWSVAGFDQQAGRHYRRRYRFGNHDEIFEWQPENTDT